MGRLGDIMKNRSALKTSNTSVTSAAQLTLRQSLYPLALVTSLFFLWVSASVENATRSSAYISGPFLGYAADFIGNRDSHTACLIH